MQLADNTIFASCGSLDMVKELIEEQVTLITDWFNSMKMNPEKFHVTITGNDDVPEHFKLSIDNIKRELRISCAYCGLKLIRS